MAFTTDNIFTDGDIEVVVRIDSALDMTDEEYAEYLKTLDESLLKLKPGESPTRFVMRKNINLRHSKNIENSKISVSDDNKVTVGMGFVIDEVRAALKEIKYGPEVPENKRIVLKFVGDGLVDSRLMESFVSAGIVQNLYQARKNYLDKHSTASSKKS